MTTRCISVLLTFTVDEDDNEATTLPSVWDQLEDWDWHTLLDLGPYEQVEATAQFSLVDNPHDALV